ncbi:alpha-2-macroglobulin family protein [Flavobacterium cutihirudinis]|uniref:Alpha-2-macroglobulin family protein n=1 Tax=Flavobacterium cutihirudinis TaxID=1265740 RepID=A0A3D9FKH3_9FLAO|nr:alpha-2-macroglobulin family protein [Flavobacterium cutihirudinis]RED19679.1 alpha-2-macroglobulin family protein [Flavobacterium cutihirudinis]
MKNILFVFLLISTAVFSQQNAKKWEKVRAFENEGKIKSANEIVTKIYKRSVARKDEVQMIKCFFYQSKYSQVLDENSKTKIVDNLKTDISRVSIPSKAILNLIYAKYLKDHSNYYDDVYAIVDSAAVMIDSAAATIDTAAVSGIKVEEVDSVEVPHSDYIPQEITTEDDVIATFNKTLENEAILKATPLIKYKDIFDYPDLEKFKQENLWNYLLKENITFFTEKIESWKIRNSDFSIYKDQILGNSNAFLKLNLDFLQEPNAKKVLALYQKLESDDPSLKNQLERAKFCQQYLLKSNEDFSVFLNKIEKETQDKNLIQNIKLEQAQILLDEASKELHPSNNIKALEVLNEVIKINENSNFAKQAVSKKYDILSKFLAIQFQKNSYENENTRAFINYKNVKKFKISFYKIDLLKVGKFSRLYEVNRDSLANSIVKNQNIIKTENYNLIDKENYFTYSTEVLLPKLPVGNYLAYFESDSDSKDQKSSGFEVLTISNISVLASKKERTENYQVLDRKTGKPLKDVTVEFEEKNAKTNLDGIATFNSETNEYDYNYRQKPIKLTQTGDSILVHKNYLPYKEDYKLSENNRMKGKIEFYLDRAIYRPGQTVFYKGIAIQKSNNKTSITANATFKINVSDGNGQSIKEFEVTTNEYGSFFGEFTIPKTGITGSYLISAQKPENLSNTGQTYWDKVSINYSNATMYFRVEEYKRPKFEVTFDAKKESFQLNQPVKIKGSAKAFAGSNISDATVKYTVTRYTTYLRNYYGREENETLAVGETKTDNSGKFVIDFTAIPPKNNSKENLPIFNYEISAAVTDINGETHSALTNVKIGYHDLILSAQIANTIETKNNNEVALTSTNLNGEFLAVKGEIKLYYLNPLSSKFKTRKFLKPEIETISPEDFDKLFPYEISENEANKNSSETLLFSKNIDTQKDKKVLLDFISNYKSGNYKIVFSAKDTFGNPIETTSNFIIKQSKDKFNPSKLLNAQQLNSDPKKDGFVLVKITSIIPELYVLTNANYQNKTYFDNHIHLQNHETTVKVPLKKEFETQILVDFQCVFDNDIFTETITIPLKSQEQKLEWTIESFRNKIQPGTNENWSFKLNGFNTKKEAEVLASMYDSSLDQFSVKNWDLLKFEDNYYNGTNFKTGLGFDISYASVENLNERFPQLIFSNEETQLKWFGFNFYDSRYGDSLGITITELKDKKVGSETIKGDPDAVMAVGAGLANAVVEEDNQVYNTAAVAMTLDEVRFVKPVVASAQETTENPPYFQTNKVKFIPGKKIISGLTNMVITASTLYVIDGEISSEDNFNKINPEDILDIDFLTSDKAIRIYGSKGANGVIIITTKKALEALTQVKARKNLSETAFFLPNLKTDATGKVSFNFTSPEALTAWKLRLLAHNKDAVSGYLEKSVVTQKELMLLPNFPRFFREKDTILISAKISNITDKAKSGIAILQFFDAVTMQPIDAKMLNAKNVRNFNVGAFGNTTATWTISIPEGLQGVQYKILAKADNFSDGEENILPVLTNNMLVTESIPVWVRENSTKEYTFENLKSNNSSTLRNHQFTLEYTSNPTWLAIQSLPYLMEYEHECAEQTFARFYANSLASEIISSNPKIATLFEDWRKSGKLNSKLEENEELKSLILAETPWLKDAQNENEKKKNLALLFDLEKMKTSQEATFEKLKQKQKSSGGFSWFDGSDENEYITRHILAGLGHLSKLNNKEDNENKIDEIAKTGIPFLDAKFLESYKNRTKNLKPTEKLIWINPNADLHYLYARSFYLENYKLSDTLKKATKLYIDVIKKDWLSYSLYEKGLATLALNRFGEKETAKKIIESLKETSSNNEDWGMYWIANKSGWFWYQAPIETQALLIEAFAEVNNDTKSVDAMKVWLLKNKQTKNWPTTKSTTEAIYALLMQGTDWLSVKDNTVIKLGDEKIITKKLAENEKEAETGYIKLNWKADEIKKEMASIKIQNKSKVSGFGGVYWQYFEDLDKIKNNSGAVLSVSKELYLKKSTLKGQELEKITAKNSLKTGDLVTVRLIITSKEDTEYVHLKDMRASCFEPVNVLSEYQYKDRLGYYMSTKDAATHFFFDQINKGTYVLEYDIRVNNSGEFSNGITTIQSMYAPEFASHTKGIRVKVN